MMYDHTGLNQPLLFFLVFGTLWLVHVEVKDSMSMSRMHYVLITLFTNSSLYYHPTIFS